MKLLLALLLLLSSSMVDAKDVKTESLAGGINWTQGIIYANGYGTAKPGLSSAQRKILSRRAAVVDAQRNLLEITKGVRIDSKLTTDAAMKESLEVATRIEGIVKGAQVTDSLYQNDISTVTMSMPLSGEFIRVMYPKKQLADIQPVPSRLNPSLLSYGNALLNFLVPPVYASEAFVISNEAEVKAYRKLILWMQNNANDELSKVLETAVVRYETSAKFSGLLIDASAVPSFELATIPKIRDDTGNIIYPNDNTSYDDIVNKRGVTYDFDLQDAIRNKRVATTPFIIRATSTYKTLPSDLVISKADAAKILQSQSTSTAMNKAGVLIVVAI